LRTRFSTIRSTFCSSTSRDHRGTADVHLPPVEARGRHGAFNEIEHVRLRPLHLDDTAAHPLDVEEVDEQSFESAGRANELADDAGRLFAGEVVAPAFQGEGEAQDRGERRPQLV
jgi:hypothetical protein